MKRKEAKIINVSWVRKNTYIIYPNGDIYRIADNRKVKSSINGNGYKYVSLLTNKKKTNEYKSISLHRLMALVFIPRSKDDIKMNRVNVHFKDFDKDNITISNLEWLSSFELNIKILSRYNDDCDVRECLDTICKCLEKGYAPKEVCDLVGLRRRATPMIGKIYHRQAFKDMTRKYKF